MLYGGQSIAKNTTTTHREIYVFHYATSDSILVQRLFEKIDPGINGLEQFFGAKSNIPIQIFITKSQSEFNLHTGQGIPEWAQAIAISQKRMIIIRAANGDEILELPRVLLHELVHIYLGILSPQKRIPTWLHEGVAQYLSHDGLTMDEQILIASALYSDRVGYLTDLDSMLSFSPVKAKLGYALARSAVDYFVQQYGVETLFQTLKELHNHSVNDAFVETTGKDLVDFEAGWFAYIDERYSWMFLLNAENYVWALFVVLFFAALIRLKFKNRKTLNKWEEDTDIFDTN